MFRIQPLDTHALMTCGIIRQTKLLDDIFGERYVRMEIQIIEGSFEEVQRKLSALPLKPETPVRVVVSEPEALNTQIAEPFTPTEFRNGLPLLPRRQLKEPITIELVKRLSEDFDSCLPIVELYREVQHNPMLGHMAGFEHF